MFDGFKSFDVQVEPEITIHGVTAGTGPALLLLHGFPQTHHIWHIVAPQLISSFTIVAMDLRGYGASSKPAASATHASYAKSTMAKDCVTIMSHLGYEKFNIVSHDRGARVAHKLCVDHPDKVDKCMFLDIAPTLSMYDNTNQEFATRYWHWFFLIQPNPLPETLLLNSPMVFKTAFFGSNYGVTGKGFFDDEALKAYEAQLTERDTVTGMCEDYRAASTIDLDEARNDVKEGRKIKCPVRIIWGKKGVIEKCFDALGLWRAVSDGEVSGEAVNSGHYIAEEAPDDLLRNIRAFFK